MSKHPFLFLAPALFLTACATSLVASQDGATSVSEVSSEAVSDPRLGVYSGSYVCARGENGLTLSLDEFVDAGAASKIVLSASARLWFYDTAGNPGHPAGAFAMSGTVIGDTIELTPDEWLSAEPEDWGAAGITAQFVEDSGETYLDGRPSGPGTSACVTFRLKRLKGL